jgi:hypothetical protein
MCGSFTREMSATANEDIKLGKGKRKNEPDETAILSGTKYNKK